MIPAKQIVRNWDWENHNHRRDFETCPSCGHRMKYEDWDKYATILILDIIHGKHGSVGVVSECPKCFEKSWTHQLVIGYFEHISEEWQDAVDKERKERIAVAQRNWDTSLCRTCKRIDKAPREKDTIAYRTCYTGMGSVTKKCDQYRKGKVNKMVK